jgi:long-chain acyl-CoA synthetase
MDADRPMTLPAALAWAARTYGNRRAYVDYSSGSERSLSWSELEQRARDFAAGLVGLGLAAGDRVAIVATNSSEWIVAFHAIAIAGGIGVPVYYDLRAAEVAGQTGRTGCRFVIADAGVLDKLPAASPGLEKVIVIGEGSHPSIETLPFDAVATAATEASRATLAARMVAPSDLAAVFFTSGSTGGPKGVMLTHANLLANGHAIRQRLAFTPDDVVLLVLPLHHALPFQAAVVLVSLIGATIVIENDLKRVRERMQAVRPTVFFGVPALYEIMLRNVLARAEAEGRLAALQTWQKRLGVVKRLTGVNLAPIVFGKLHKALGGRLRFLVGGGAALNPPTVRAFAALGLPLIQGWGMTEAAPAIAVQPFSARRFRYTDYYEKHAGSVGAALPGIEVKLVDVPEKQIEVAASGEGEVLVRGANVFAGYWQAPEATAAAIDAGGWLHTGDLGRIDSDGNIYLTGRSKYVIVLASGEKVHPDEVEAKLGEGTLIGDVVVLARRDARDRTVAGAIVYPDIDAVRERCASDGVEVTEENVRRIVTAEIETLCRDLASYKRVADVQLSDTPLPKTPLRKVAREQVPAEPDFVLERWLASAAETAAS